MTSASPTSEPQTSIYETTIDNPELEQLLEDREQKKATVSAARGEYKQADDAARHGLATLELGDGAAVRVGRFVVTLRPVAARSVSFDTAPTSRLTIRPLAEDA